MTMRAVVRVVRYKSLGDRAFILSSSRRHALLWQQQQQRRQAHAASPEVAQIEQELTTIAQSIRFVDPIDNLPVEPGGGQLSEFEKRLGHSFRNRWLLRLALIHSSAAPETDNASLAWLGDAALGLLCTERLLASMGPGTAVGVLTQARDRAVSRQQCEARARALGLESLLVIGQSIQGSGNISSSMLAESYESVLGAVYVDGGLSAVRAVHLKGATSQPLHQQTV